jgi:hypothetical protein
VQTWLANACGASASMLLVDGTPANMPEWFTSRSPRAMALPPDSPALEGRRGRDL